VDEYRTASDDRLVALGLGGDQAAYGELVERYKDGLVNYLTRMTGERAAAEDLAHDAFVRLFERAATYRPQGKFRAYLYRIAVNLLRSKERRRQRWRLVAARFLSTNGDRPAPAAAARLLGDERDRQVADADAVARLPHRFRAPIVLFNIEGWSYREIAAALGCREGTVKSRIHRGRQLLRQELAPYWTGESA
jgi:RNA polymerase sigma-70 factor (ECF subfamily)